MMLCSSFTIETDVHREKKENNDFFCGKGNSILTLKFLVYSTVQENYVRQKQVDL